MSRNNFVDDGVGFVAQDLALSFANGVHLFSELSFSLGHQQKVGLVGRNGVGKSQLLKIIVGEVRPSRGQVSSHLGVGYLPQHYGLNQDTLIADVLGVRKKIEALRAIESGMAEAGPFEVLNDDWDIEARLQQLLSEIDLAKLDLRRRFSSLSGGEATRVYLAGLMLQKPSMLVLDEPTNNLDAASREALYRMLTNWRGTLLVVSHDRKLLNLLDRIMELSTLGLKQYEGNYDHYVSLKAIEAEAMRRSLKHAQTELKKTQSDVQKNLEKHQQRQARGRNERRVGSQPKVVLNARQERSEATASGLKKSAARQLMAQRQSLDQVRKKVEDLETIDVSMVSGQVPSGKVVIDIEGLHFAYPDARLPLIRDFNLKLCGPERVWLKGTNGCGKTTLLQLIQQASQSAVPANAWRGHIKVGVEKLAYLDQQIAVLNPAKSVFQNFCAFQPNMLESEVRWRLAKFLFRGETVFKEIRQLSGGERLRAALACLLMSEAAPQLLLLDEPTNHLDLEAIASLENILNQYQGALLVISHDETFVQKICVDRTIELEPPSPA